MAAAAVQTFGLRAALAGLRLAIRSPSDTLFYRYRAIESIRQEFLPVGNVLDEV